MRKEIKSFDVYREHGSGPGPAAPQASYAKLAIATVFLVAVVLAIFWPDTLEHLRRVGCSSNLRKLGLALQMFADENNGAHPPDARLLYGRYVRTADTFVCPSVRGAVPVYSGAENTPLPPENISYCYVAGTKDSDPPHFIVAFDEEWNHAGDGANVLYAANNIVWYGDMEAVRKQLAHQKELMAEQGRVMSIIRPVWSRYPEPPAHFLREQTARANWSLAGIIAGISLIVLYVGYRTWRWMKKRKAS